MGTQARVAYIMSRFPKVSETFILFEILELQRLGLEIAIFPLVRQREQIMHPEAQPLVASAHYSSFLSFATLTSQIYWLAKRPLAYLHTWWQAIRGNLSSPKFLVRAVVVVPQAALFARRMQALGIEHVHAHWATHPALAAYVIHQLTGLPYSFTAHADDIYVERAMLDQKIREASFVVTCSEYNWRLLGQLYGALAEQKTVVVHHGVDSTAFQPRPGDKSNQPLTIICVARLEEKKGIAYLVEACAQLKAQDIAFRCLLVGDGNLRAQLEAQVARLNLGDRVLLLGQQPRARIGELLAEANVMVLPSITTRRGNQDGIPNSLIEALATEVPVITTAISAIPELVEDGVTGLLVPEHDAAAISRAVLRLRQDPAFGKRMGIAGRAKVMRKFNARQNAARLHALLTYNWSSAPATSAKSLLASAIPEKG